MTATVTRGHAAAAVPAEQKKPAKGLLKSKKMIIVLVALLGVGGGAYMTLKPSKPAPVTGGDVVALDPTTVNLTDGHYLKVAVAVQLIQGKGSTEDFKTSHAAELVIDQFADRSVASLSSNSARRTLAADLEAKIKKAYPDEVYDIFLTQFVTQ